MLIFANWFGRRAKKKKPYRQARPRVEELEPRITPENYSWTPQGASTSWDIQTNWTPNGIPNSVNDSVTLSGGAQVNDCVMNIPGGVTIGFLTLDPSWSGKTLTLNDRLSVTSLSMNGGVIDQPNAESLLVIGENGDGEDSDFTSGIINSTNTKGTVIVRGGNILHISNSASDIGSNLIIEDASVIFESSGTRITNNADIQVTEHGILTFSGNGTTGGNHTRLRRSQTSSAIWNFGIINRTGGTGYARCDLPIFNSGEIRIDGGYADSELDVSGSSPITNGYSIFQEGPSAKTIIGYGGGGATAKLSTLSYYQDSGLLSTEVATAHFTTVQQAVVNGGRVIVRDNNPSAYGRLWFSGILDFSGGGTLVVKVQGNGNLDFDQFVSLGGAATRVILGGNSNLTVWTVNAPDVLRQYRFIEMPLGSGFIIGDFSTAELVGQGMISNHGRVQGDLFYFVRTRPAQANQAPVAQDDIYSVLQDTTLVDALLNNDYDPDDEPIFVFAVNDSVEDVGTSIILPSGATLFLNADGSFSYTPAVGFVGVDSFTYTISDGIDEATTLVTIEVIPI